MAANPAILSLEGKGLKLDTRADIEPYLRDVDPTKVEEVHFGGNTLGVEASQALAEWLEKTTILKVADFADIFTGRLISEIPQALSAICDALKSKETLVEINLSDNAFGGRSVDPMVPFLIENRWFQILRLNNNGLGPTGGAVIADALLQSAKRSKALGQPSNLRTVICGRNRLEDGSAEAWAEAFREHGGLVEIRMPQNGIRMDGIASLVTGIASCKGLQHLDLQDNTFGEKGSKRMAAVLKGWPQLHTLNLSDCVLAAEGEVSSVVEVLAAGSNPKLRTLQLQNNNLEAQTFALLAQGISTHLAELKMLEVQWNDVEEDDEGIASLAGVLAKRGGKIFITDEEEEEEEEEEAEAEEAEAGEAAEAEGEGKKPEESEEAKEQHAPSVEPTPKGIVDKTADALADLMSKVKIG